MLAKIQQYINAAGNINSKMLNNIPEEFINELREFTNFLIEPKLSHRIKCVKLGITEHTTCKFCNTPLRYSRKADIMFKIVCTCEAYKIHLYARPERKIIVARCNETKLLKKNAFIASDILNIDEVRSVLTANAHYIRNYNQYELAKFLKSIHGLKESIFFYSSGDRISERVSRLICEHSCKTCGCDTGFISLKDGFRQYCIKHCADYGTKKNNNLELARNVLRDYNYSIISEPHSISHDAFIVKCDNNHEFQLSLKNGKISKNLSKCCPQCFPKNISNAEYEIKEWLETHNIEVVQQYIIAKNGTGRKTIDLYLPQFKIGIEFDGLIWHSFGKSKHTKFDNAYVENKNNHLSKTQLCNDVNIQLFHIFENEWETNCELWKSVILSKCGLSYRIYARKCLICNISDAEYQEFIEINHMQGYAKASIRLALTFDNDIVAVASFSKNRFSDKADWELIRFASKLGTTVIGGFSKLLTHFKRNHTGSVISYANRRWSVGNVYEKNGFELLNESSPNYWWLDDKLQFHSRQKFQRHKLNDTSNKTESEIMFDRGYRRIWDCGNLVYRLP